MISPAIIRHLSPILAILLFFTITGYSQKQMLDNALHHLRNADPIEWLEFTSHPEKQLVLKFTANRSPATQTLSLRQYDVKQNWQVLINDRDIGNLVVDEKDLMAYFSIPAGTLREGENILVIKCSSTVPDDIRVGEISLDSRSPDDVFTEASLEVSVFETGTNTLIPARITVLTDKRSIGNVVSTIGEKVVVRSGYAYTGTGKASLQLPAGRYTIYAGRGFEYGIDSMQIELEPGDRVQKTFRLKREVETAGWVCSDTHIHTVTHSHHGDATEEERVITLAGEGIELPVMTDHNIYVDLNATARAAGVRSYFTPVTGDELTTKVGHFNVFRTTVGTPVIDHNAENWNDIAENIGDAGTKVVILNHAQDIHNDFRPFDPSRHLSSAGTSKDDWKFPANAMEVINSGSQQTDYMQLYRDWFGMLNRGYFLTPVGSSDSHDVSRFTVGQGRTYIQANDENPGNINVDQAIKSFREGRVMVSAGLLTKITVNNTFGPGDIVLIKAKVQVSVEVAGPSWVRAERVSLYANGKKIHEEKIDQLKKQPLKWKSSWTIEAPKQDIFLVAIAEGPGEGMPWWPIAKPYQRTSGEWTPKVIGSTGAVWIDADNNGKRDSAYDYAKAIVDSSKGDVSRIVKKLDPYDGAVAAQAAALLWKSGLDLNTHEVLDAVRNAEPETKAGFERVITEIGLIGK
ncbi:MAG TPA: CehA/McbA family metallohydrolase [Cyclobacteriaceae bacterium]|nr:CehA/McbA family metallohydrolase [Cyclobacteriaceae bacterium]